mmetsp:Transcript_95809/g.270863  ORF Transcript_95809/g.270863 Transcript_95809/m.270863 type:complete len:415 (-) Transcript_95809:43-1287(-)
MAGETPPARNQEVAALLCFDVLHRLSPDLVLGEVSALRDVGPEVVLLDVRHTEEVHRPDVHKRADGEAEVVVRQRNVLEREIPAEGKAVVPDEEAPVAIGEHPAKQVVPDVGGCQVRGLVQVVVEDVVPVREGDHQSSGADAVPGARLHAVHLAVVDMAVEVHRGEEGLVRNDPERQARASVPEALQVEGHLQPAVEEARVPRHAEEVVVEELAEAEDAPVLLELGVVDVAPPQEAKVDVQPQGHELGNDDAAREQGPQIRPDEVWAQQPEPADDVAGSMRQEEANEAVHGILQLPAVLEGDTLHDLGRDEDLHCRLEDNPDRDGPDGLPCWADGGALWEREVKVIPELPVRDHQLPLVQHGASVPVVDRRRDEDHPKQGAKVSAKLPDWPALLADDLTSRHGEQRTGPWTAKA